MDLIWVKIIIMDSGFMEIIDYSYKIIDFAIKFLTTMDYCDI